MNDVVLTVQGFIFSLSLRRHFPRPKKGAKCQFHEYIDDFNALTNGHVLLRATHHLSQRM
jgi:hypothetical protein